jgi:hypothetical protein
VEPVTRVATVGVARAKKASTYLALSLGASIACGSAPRRYAQLEAGDIQTAVDDFLDGEWANLADHFTFCTSVRIADTKLEKTIVAAHEQLAAHSPPIAFDVWDAHELSLKLEASPTAR